MITTTSKSMDPELAKKLFHEGATLVILDVPQGTEFGIDYNSWTVGPKFKGVKMIPPGFHFVFYSVVSKDKKASPRTGFLHFFKQKELVVRRWDKSLEVISSEGILSEDEDRLRISLMDLDSSLGAYPYESLKKWVSLSNYVTEEIVATVRPHNGCVSSVTQVRSDDVHSEKLQKESTQESSSEQLFAGVGYFTAESINSTDSQSTPQCTLQAEPDSVLRFHLVSTKYPKDSTPAQISHHCMDFSFTLEEMLKRYFTSEDELLGELQLAFLCFLQGQVYDAFEHWKSLVQLLCSCEEAMKCHPKFFSNLISVLHFQLKEIPKDFFVDIVSRKNFLTTTLQIFFSILEASNGSLDASLVKKGLKFQDSLNKQFKWDFSVEPDEYAPTVVD
ncbi:protein AAR2 homolog [Halichondria panicea]|uniref:protein AAR2 homolog n=1 Tax=Halichondria panicea TaxID=6063 RepID=UPI00312B7B89